MIENKPVSHDGAPCAPLIREFVYPQDLDAIRLLWETSGPGVQLGRSDEPEEIRKKLERDPDLFLIAEMDDKIVGTVLGGFDGRRGMVYHLAIAEGYRQKGIGSVLMDELEQRLRLKGCLRCYLLVTVENEQAIRFYERRGWERMPLFAYGKNIS